MAVLQGLRVVQLGPGLAAAICGRFFADAGASVTTIGAGTASALAPYLAHGKAAADQDPDALTRAEVIVCEGAPGVLRTRGHDPDSLRRLNASAVIATISGFGQNGPRADAPATDLTLFCASGLARLLTGQVDDLSEPPLRAVGGQSAVIGGLAAACAAMAAVTSRGPKGAVIDVSMQEALATLAAGELAHGGLNGTSWSRKRVTDGNGATVTILPASDGYVVISPREVQQWTRWCGVMGSPAWADDARFARKADRVANWDALHALMAAWSRDHTKQWIAEAAQAAHVPSFPLGELAEHLGSAQLESRDFFRPIDIDGQTIKAPGAPYHVAMTAPGGGTGEPSRKAPATASGPLAGLRVLDFSWVIAGPTATRHLAALGADVIKVEAPGRGDPARASDLHTVLGQGKRAIVLDLKNDAAIDVARALVGQADVLIENFATGVMERLGLGAAALQAANPNLIYLSASGLGRTGPDAGKVAYGTLLQSYAGFAGLNRHPGTPPRIGFAWLDPMCGLMLPFIVAAALWRRERAGGGVRVDFSMIEAMLWTLAEPLLATQVGAVPAPRGNASTTMAPHGVYPCAGDDRWIGLAVQCDAQWQALCARVSGLAGDAGLNIAERMTRRAEIDAVLAAWTAGQPVTDVAAALDAAGIANAAVVGTQDLVADPHLAARAFWQDHASGVLPGLPWQADFDHHDGPPPGLGADTDAVLAGVLGLTQTEIDALRANGALG